MFALLEVYQIIPYALSLVPKWGAFELSYPMALNPNGKKSSTEASTSRQAVRHQTSSIQPLTIASGTRGVPSPPITLLPSSSIPSYLSLTISPLPQTCLPDSFHLPPYAPSLTLSVSSQPSDTPPQSPPQYPPDPLTPLHDRPPTAPLTSANRNKSANTHLFSRQRLSSSSSNTTT